MRVKIERADTQGDLSGGAATVVQGLVSITIPPQRRPTDPPSALAPERARLRQSSGDDPVASDNHDVAMELRIDPSEPKTAPGPGGGVDPLPCRSGEILGVRASRPYGGLGHLVGCLPTILGSEIGERLDVFLDDASIAGRVAEQL